jgi:hypothetical protein
MMRRDAVEAVGCYRAEFESADDLDLWLRLADIGHIANLADPLSRGVSTGGDYWPAPRDTCWSVDCGGDRRPATGSRRLVSHQFPPEVYRPQLALHGLSGRGDSPVVVSCRRRPGQERWRNQRLRAARTRGR